MSTTVAKIAEIEAEMARTQKNKATNAHLGVLKAKIAKLRKELIAPKKGGPTGEGFEVTKSGDARVGLIGFPSVSTIATRVPRWINGFMRVCACISSSDIAGGEVDVVDQNYRDQE